MVQSWNVLEKQCWKQSREVSNTVLNFKWLTFGFVNYLSKFMPCLADVSQLLHDLKTKEANFLWSPQQEAVFDKGKQLVVNHSVLKNYNPQTELTLQCDGRRKDLGLLRPRMDSQSHSPPEHCHRQKGTTPKSRKSVSELSSVVIVLTNTSPQRIKSLLSSTTNLCKTYWINPYVTCRLQRMLLRLLRYNLDVQYRKGS